LIDWLIDWLLAGCLRSCLCNAGRECCGGCACGGCNGRAGVGSAGHDPEKAAASGASSSTGLIQQIKTKRFFIHILLEFIGGQYWRLE